MHKLRLLGFIAFAILCIFVSQYNPQKNSPKFQPTGLNSHFISPSPQSFADYVQTSTTMVKDARTKAQVRAGSKIVRGNSPLILTPDPNLCKKDPNGKYKNGILLIHGLFDSPYPMQVLGRYFQSKCFLTYVLLLPGHGTVPGDLLKVNFQDWIAATHFGATQLATEVNQVWLGGHSLGGTLAINEALENRNGYKALILFAPALKINSPLLPFAKPIYYASVAIPAFQWWKKYSESSPYSYESVAVNAVYQAKRIMDKVSEKLETQNLTLPLFIEQSADDTTIKADQTLKLMEKDPNPLSQMLWFSSKGSSPSTDTRIKTLTSYIPDQRILSLSHISLTSPDTDPVYGLHGIYKSCLQYPEQSTKWLQCKTGLNTYQGEITPYNLDRYLLQRITFNPFYGEMIKGLDQFIAEKGVKTNFLVEP